ncbi:MAG TPA: hypothetical protein VLC74_04970 [Rhizomicrobium sp.]|nr:hypothetical protein [Rhizomicrobium sp.]
MLHLNSVSTKPAAAQIYNHDNGGGMKLQNISIHNFLEQFTKGTVKLRESDCPITGLATDMSTGYVNLTYATTAGVANTDCNIVAGDTVLLLGLGGSGSITLNGSTTGSTITGLQEQQCDANKPNCVQFVHVGDVVTGPCIPAYTTVSAWHVGTGLNGGSVDLFPTFSGSCSNVAFTFAGTSSGYPGLNGRFLVTSASTASGGRTAILTGSSLGGPAVRVNYNAGANAVTIDSTSTGGATYDTTNIGAGQYLCASSPNLAPFCGPPSAFGFNSATLSGTLTNCSSPSVTVTSSITPDTPLAGWPAAGLMKISNNSGTEVVSYTIGGRSKINILKRAQENTACQFFTTGTITLTPAAPQVIAVLPWANAVALNAKAQSNSSSTATFANDQTTNSAFFGAIVLNSGYHTWTANPNAGATPDAAVIAKATGATTSSVTIDVDPFKIQEGMVLQDLTVGQNLGVSVSQTPTSSTISLSGDPGAVSGHMLRFSGCGYPGLVASGVTKTPWLGNCAATAFAFNGASGSASNYINAHGWRVYEHLIDSQETVGEEGIFDSGAGNNATVDPTAYGLLIEGTADKIEIADGKFAAWNGIVNLPTDQSNGMGLVNLNISQTTTALANGPLGKIAASNLKGGDTQAGITWLDSAMDSFSGAALRLAGSIYVFADPSALAKQYCDRSSHLGSGECGQSLASLSCIVGCGGSGGVTGSDDRFDVTTNGSATTITIQLAGLYDTAPICTATTGGPSGGATSPIAVSMPPADTQPYWTQVTFITSSAAAHIYGSCH